MILFSSEQAQQKSFTIAWLFPHANLALDPSNRLRRYQISHHFKKMPGLITRSENFFIYDKRENLREELLKFDIIVLFNINEYDLDLVRFLKNNKKIIIFDHCENIFGLGHEDEIMRNVSAITCCSTFLARHTDNYLRQKYNVDQKIFIIKDSMDDSALLNHLYPSGVDTALIMGMGANVQYVLPTLEKYCHAANYKIMILTENGFSFPNHQTKNWAIDTWISHALKCSVALCYHSATQFPAKGNVKVTNPMSIGLPVIAVPIEAYKEAIVSGYTGFIAQTDEDWVNALNALKNPGFRNLMGLRAKQAAMINYSTAIIALNYLSMINNLMDNPG